MPQCQSCNVSAAFHELVAGKCHKCTYSQLQTVELVLKAERAELDRVLELNAGLLRRIAGVEGNVTCPICEATFFLTPNPPKQDE